MAQKTFVAGDVLAASDVNTYLMGEGGAWTTFSPTITQSGTVTRTATRAKYARYGRTIHFSMLLSVIGTGTAENDITITLPVASASADVMVGTGYIYDASANTVHPGWAYATSTTVVKLIAIEAAIDNSVSPSTTANGLVGAPFYLGSNNSFDEALASGDSIVVSGTYEAAS